MPFKSLLNQFEMQVIKYVGLSIPSSGDVAQLVQRQTGTPLTQVRFPSEERDFSPKVNFQCRLSYCASVHPRVQSHALTNVLTLNIL